MDKIKVHELAKKLGISNNEVIEDLKKIGIEVKSHLSSISKDEYDKFLNSRKVSNMAEKKEEMKPKKQSEQLHIIRRNVKVINTSEDKKEIQEITTKINGDILKNKQVISKNDETKNSSGNDKNFKDKGKFQQNKPGYPRNNFGRNRNVNVVVTRNGKVVEPETKKEEIKKEVTEVKVEKIKELPSRTKDVDIVKAKSNIISNTASLQNEKDNKSSNYDKKNQRDNNQERRQNGDRRQYSNYNNANGDRRQNNNFNSPSGERRQYNNYNNASGDRRQYNNYNANGDRRQGAQNKFGRQQMSQVDRFVKSQADMNLETKEQRDYSATLIDKKKYNNSNSNSNTDGKKEKLNKNELRERHSRVSTSRLRGMEVDSSDSMLDLYERESDSVRKYGKKKKEKKQDKAPIKIVPLTEVKLPESMTVKEFAEAIKKQAAEVIKKLFGLGIMATQNQEIDFDTAFLVAEEFGINAKKISYLMRVKIKMKI